MSELYENLLAATDNTSDITVEKYGTVVKIVGDLCSVKEEETDLEHSNVPILNKVPCELGDKVVLGFVNNSIYNPFVIGNLTRKISGGGGVDVPIVTEWSQNPSDDNVPSEKLTKDSLDGKASSNHTHNKSEISDFTHTHSYNDLNNKPTIPSKTSQLTNDSGFLSSLPTHNHDDRYYTETEMDGLLNNKLDVADAFSGSYDDLTDVPSTFAPSSHSHSISDVTDLSGELADKLESSDVGEAALTNDYEDLDNLPTLFDGNYNSLSNKPSTFTPSEHNHSDLDIRTYYALPNLGLPDDTKQSTVNGAIDSAIANHNHSDLDVRINSALPNLGLSVDEKQTNVNRAIDTAIGYLGSIKAIEVVSTKPIASSSTMGKLYIISENNKVNVYYTEENNGSYSWHKMDADILDDLSIDWSDIQNKPSIPTKTSDLTNDGDDGTNVFVKNNDSRLSDARTPTSHNHGAIGNDGKFYRFQSNTLVLMPNCILVSNNYSVITGMASLSTTLIKNSSALTNIGTSANATQSVINTSIDTALGNKANTSDLGAVALSNSYDDLDDLPTLFSGSYTDLTNVPSTFNPSSHNHNYILNNGTITQTVTNNGKLVVTNSSNQVGVESAIDVLDGIVNDLIDYGGS